MGPKFKPGSLGSLYILNGWTPPLTDSSPESVLGHISRWRRRRAIQANSTMTAQTSSEMKCTTSQLLHLAETLAEVIFYSVVKKCKKQRRSKGGTRLPIYPQATIKYRKPFLGPETGIYS